MPRVSHQFVVDRPIGAVFDVVTTARFWPEWHPATRAVGGDVAIRLGVLRISYELATAGQRGTR